MEATWVSERDRKPDAGVYTSYLSVPGDVVVRTVVESDLDGRVSLPMLLVPGARVEVRDGVVHLEPESPRGDGHVEAEKCDHSPPAGEGFLGQLTTCFCGEQTYRFDWGGPNHPSVWEPVGGPSWVGE